MDKIKWDKNTNYIYGKIFVVIGMKVGLAVAVAKNIVSAKKAIREKYGKREPYVWGYLEVYDLDKVDKPFCEFVVGGS